MKMNLKTALKLLNKNVSDGDMFRVASEIPRERFDVALASTGSPYLDYKVGGIGFGRMTLLTGWEGSGKSSIAVIMAKKMQDDFGKIVVYFDSENAVTNSHIDRFGINRELLIPRVEYNLEAMLNQIKVLAQVDEVGMIIIDSVKGFFTSSEEEKDANQHTIGLAAKRWNTQMPILLSYCHRNNVALVIINQWRENPGAGPNADARVLAGGHWQKYLPSLHLDFGSKRDNIIIYDGDKNVIGHKVDVRVKKSRYHAHKAGAIINVNLYYDYGFDKFDEYCNLLVDMGVIENRGAWYYFPNGDKEQGKEQASAYLSEHPDYLEELITENNILNNSPRLVEEVKEDE